jgi:hypothetical protein
MDPKTVSTEPNAHNAFEAAAQKEKADKAQSQNAPGSATTDGEIPAGAPAQEQAEPAGENRRPAPDATEPEEVDVTVQEAPAEPEVEDLDAPDGQEIGEEPDAATTAPEDAPEEAEDSRAFQYIGVDPDELGEEADEYVFVSGVDPRTRYKDVESMVEGHENLLRHRSRLEAELSDTRERLMDAQRVKANTEEELTSKVAFYEDQLGDDLEEILTERYLESDYPRFAGLKKSDIEDPEDLIQYGEAKAMARQKAQSQIREREEAREAKKRQQEEQAQKRKERFEKAGEFISSIEASPEEHFGLERSEVQTLLPDVLDELSTTVQTEEGEKREDPFLKAQRLYALGMEDEAEMLLDLVGMKMQSLKNQRIQDVQSRIQKKQFRRPKPQPSEEPARRESPVGDPYTSFAEAGQRSRVRR